MDFIGVSIASQGFMYLQTQQNFAVTTSNGTTYNLPTTFNQFVAYIPGSLIAGLPSPSPKAP